MALNDYAYYNTTTGLIENVLWIDDDVVPTLVWPEDYAVVDIPNNSVAGSWSMCGIGWSYIGGQFIEPPNPNAVTTLTADISSTDTVLPVVSTNTFYSSGYLRIGSEWMMYDGITANSITVVERGFDGTTAVGHFADTQVNSKQETPQAQPQATGIQNL